MILRQYQQKLKADVYTAWLNTAYNFVLAVLPMGGGKTFTFSDILNEHNGHKVAIAHRQELVSQISISLARCGVSHRIIAPNNVIRWIVRLQIEETGRSYYNPSSSCAVIGVDTLLKRYKDPELKDLLNQVTLWITDEAHHVLLDNKWGRAIKLFPNAKGLGVTATPCRADGKGLGAHADGVFNTLIEGPTMRELITMGYLCDYRIFAPPSDLDLTPVNVSKTTGDYNPVQLKQQVQKSHIVGDVVSHYLRIAPGKLGVTFVTDVETATQTAAEFRAKGVKAEVLHAKVKDSLRVDIIRRFRRKEIQQIVNVDILGEGFDVPGIEVVSMARPTQSFALFCQQFGRALRPADGKPYAIIIDHVNNVVRHSLPDAVRYWSLDRRERKKKNKDPNLIPMVVCQVCTAPYEKIYKKCPFCGHIHEVGDRSKPEYVEGDLTELDPATLAQMRGEIERIDAPADELQARMLHAHAPPLAAAGAAKNHRLRQDAQKLLRDSIAWWRGHMVPGTDDSIAYRRFYFKFGVDVATAQTLGRKDAEELAIRINKDIDAIVNGR